MKIIWQTEPGQQSEFEQQFLRELVFSSIPHEALFDNGNCRADANGAVIVYSGYDVPLSDRLAAYFAQSTGYSLVHISDERLQHDPRAYAGAKVVLRSYYNPQIRAENVYALPLGFQSGFLNLSGAHDFAHRDLVWCFAGQIKSNRKKMVSVLSRFKPHQLVLTNQWADPNGLSVEQMTQVYARSVFAPCPFGNRNPDSFRLMESLEHGCIPVVLKFLGHDYFRYVMGDHPFIIDRTWAGAARQMQALMADPVRLRAKQEEVAGWYSNYKKNLSLDMRDIFAGVPRQNLRSLQFRLQQDGVDGVTGLFYRLYYGRGLVRRLFRAVANALV